MSITGSTERAISEARTGKRLQAGLSVCIWRWKTIKTDSQYNEPLVGRYPSTHYNRLLEQRPPCLKSGKHRQCLESNKTCCEYFLLKACGNK